MIRPWHSLRFGLLAHMEVVWRDIHTPPSEDFSAQKAHRNRSDFCDFCDGDAHRGPQKSPAIFRNKRIQSDAALRFSGCDGKSLAICDFRGCDFLSPKTPSFCGISGDLAPSTRKIASDCDCAIFGALSFCTKKATNTAQRTLWY